VKPENRYYDFSPPPHFQKFKLPVLEPWLARMLQQHTEDNIEKIMKDGVVSFFITRGKMSDIEGNHTLASHTHRHVEPNGLYTDLSEK
jgi:hypothetical protein